MSELIPPVTIGLLERHGHLPDPAAVLQRFGSHYAESTNRQRQNEALALEPEAAGELEDFSALAASALDSGPESDGDLFGGSDDADWLSEEELEGLLSDDLDNPSEPTAEADSTSDGEAEVALAENEQAAEEAVEEATTEETVQASEEIAEATEAEPAEVQAEAPSESSDDAAETAPEAEAANAETAEAPVEDAAPAKKKAPSKTKRKRKSKKKKKG